jgi:ligand-binding sensor domain-containing protein
MFTKHSAIQLLCFFLLTLSLAGMARTTTDSTIIKILILNNREYFLTWYSFCEIRNNRTLELVKLENAVLDATGLNDTVWIGTEKGLYAFALKAGTIADVNALPPTLNISKLKAAADGSLWIASKNDGLWKLKNGRAEKLLDISPLYALEISPDSCIWVGSNVGLYKWNKKTGNWLRYAEEGYSGYEIPDNIVENLFSDLHNNMWVIMPDEFAFIRSQNSDAHVPGFRNISAQDFELKYITEMGMGYYVFVTSKGIFLMPHHPAEHDHARQEIKTATEQKMYQLNNKQLLLKPELDAKDISAVSTDQNGNLLLSYNSRIYCIKKRTIKNISARL